MTLDYCQFCGELILLHPVPCQPGVCVSKGCTDPQVDPALGLCRAHVEAVHAQLGRARG
jgi:hypothetical protein